MTEHVCCAHLDHVAADGAGCCAKGHAGWLLAQPATASSCAEPHTESEPIGPLCDKDTA